MLPERAWSRTRWAIASQRGETRHGDLGRARLPGRPDGRSDEHTAPPGCSTTCRCGSAACPESTCPATRRTSAFGSLRHPGRKRPATAISPLVRCLRPVGQGLPCLPASLTRLRQGESAFRRAQEQIHQATMAHPLLRPSLLVAISAPQPGGVPMTRRLASTIAASLPLRLPPAVLADLQSAGAVQLGTYGPSPAPPPPALHWPTDGNWTPEPGIRSAQPRGLCPLHSRRAAQPVVRIARAAILRRRRERRHRSPLRGASWAPFI